MMRRIRPKVWGGRICRRMPDHWNGEARRGLPDRLVTAVSAHSPTQPTPCMLRAAYLWAGKAFQDVLMVKFNIFLNIFLPILCFYLSVPYVINLKFFLSLTPRKRNSENKGIRIVCCKGDSVSENGEDFYCPFKFLTLISAALCSFLSYSLYR